MRGESGRRWKTLALLAVLLMLLPLAAGRGEEEAEPAEATERPDVFQARTSFFLNSVRSKGGLVGIDEVGVVVESLPSECEGTGVSKQSLETQVELYLRKSGLIEVKDETLGMIGEWVYVNLSGIETRPGWIAYCLSIEVRQPVFLQRLLFAERFQAIKMVGVVTWSKIFFGYCPSSDFEKVIRRTVDRGLDELANDYMKENPGAKWGGKEKE